MGFFSSIYVPRGKSILVGLFQVPRESEEERVQGEIGGSWSMEFTMRKAARLGRMRSAG